MKISPISATNFSGREVYYNTAIGESGLKNTAGFYANSTVERTLGKDHSYPKYRAYFADPMEFVSQNIKDRVDFVVYDNEPSYPAIEDVKKNYLGNNRTNYREQFEDVRNYFYRREMGGFANIEEAKKEQTKAAECTGFYDRAGDLRYKKEVTEDEVKVLQTERAELQAGIESTQSELKSQKSLNKTLENHLKNLKTMQKPYKELGEVAAKSDVNETVLYAASGTRINSKKTNSTNKYAKYENTTKTYGAVTDNAGEAYNIGKSKTLINKQASLLDKTIGKFEEILVDNKKVIAEMQQYISDLKAKASDVDVKIKNREAFIEECKEKLKPHFEALERFYKQNGIKGIKK